MSAIISYQVSDSLIQQNSVLSNDTVLDTSNSIQFIEEIDEETVIILPKREAIIKQPENLTNEDSAFYGFKNKEHIPVRTYETKPLVKNEPSVKQLFQPNLKIHHVAAWQTLILVVALLLLGFAKAFSVNRFKQTYKSLFNYRTAQEICNEEKVFFHRVNVTLTINYLIITALFVYQLKEILNYINHESTSLIFYLFIIGVLLVLNAAKLIFAQLISFIFDVSQLGSDYTFNVTLFNNLLGVLLIPVLSIMYFTSVDFSDILTYVAIPVLLLCFVLRLFRLIVIGISKGVSYFYIFVYICTLEILPLVVMIKIFIL
jgi:hypothetical protein